MSGKKKISKDDDDEYQGIKLPNALLDELNRNRGDDGSIHQPSLRRSRMTQATRKENRKLERQNKKKKGGKTERDVKGSKKESHVNNHGIRRKEESAGKTKQVENDDISDEDFEGFDGFDDESEADGLDDFDDSESEESASMSVADTMAALKALKNKKNGSELSPSDTMAALKAAKEKQKLQKTMSAEETMAALKSAKEGKKRKAEEVEPAKTKKSKSEGNKNIKGASEVNSKSKSKSKAEKFVSEREKYLMAQDEEDIDFYAKKLGLKSLKLGSKKKDSIDDGFDDILGGLDFDKFASGSETENSEDEFGEDDRDDEEEEDNSEDDEADERIDDDDEQELKPKENPYVAPVSAGKYIPPSKRRLLAQSTETESEELIVLRRQIKGLINRLSESNMGSIINEIESIYMRNPRSHVNSVITIVIIESTAMQGTLIESFLIIHAAFVSALYRTMGVEFGAHFVQTLVEEFEKHYKVGGGKEASNLLSLLSEIYTFQLISCKLMYDFIRMFLQDVNETNTEFLLKIIRNSGPQLRTDDPSSLKEIIYLLQTAVAKAEPTTINSRTKFLIESITTLKNNRQKIANETSIASTQRMKKFLGTISGITTEPLHVSLDDIHNIETKGKWWIVGAAYNNNGTSSIKNGPDFDVDAMNDILDAAEPNWMELAKKQRMNTDVRKAVFVALMSSEDYVDSCERLQKLRLKSKQEREIPRVILHCCSNEEVYNPFYALVAGKLCGQHSLKKTFQFCLWDFFSELQGGDDESSDDESGLGKLVKRSEIDEKDILRRTSNLARFYGSIVARGDMSLDILKPVDFLTAVTEVKIFLEIFFITFFEIVGKNAEKGSGGQTKKNGFGNAMFETRRDEKELAQMLIKTKDHAVLRGIQYFQKFVTSSSILPTKEKQKDRIIWGSSIISELIEGLLTH